MNTTSAPGQQTAAIAPGETLLTCLVRHARLTPERDFMRVEIAGRERRVTFDMAWREICRCAHAVRTASARRGEVALIFMPQGWEGIAFFFGSMLAGMIPSFMPTPSARQDAATYWRSHRMLIERVRPAVVITDSEQASAMRANGLLDGDVALVLSDQPAPSNDGSGEMDDVAGPDDIALLQHSSGTTGAKKGVVLTHRAVIEQIRSYGNSIDATADDVVVSWLPLYHDMGLVACLLMPAVLGQTVVLLDPFLWVARPGILFRAIARHRGSLCWLPNFAFEHLARTVRVEPAEMDLSSMRAFINCSEPCHVASFDRFLGAFDGLGARRDMLQVCYAMAETVFAVTQYPPGRPNRLLTVSRRALLESEHAIPAVVTGDAQTLLSAGPSIDGVEVEVRDDVGLRLGECRVGELWLRAPFLFDGYYHLPDQTAERLVNGWYRTRDRGFIEAGEVFVLGRLDDLLILNGRNFHAAEIEALINAVPGLKPGRNVAFGQFNPSKGSNDLIIVAETDGTATIDASALRHEAREAVFNGIGLYPQEFALVAPGWLLKTSSGKIARGANAEKHQQAKADASGARA